MHRASDEFRSCLEMGRHPLLSTALLASVLTAAAFALVLPPAEDADDAITARACQIGDAPVAVITPLPDAVSNGTVWELSARQSYDLDGFIASYNWTIVYGKVTEYLGGVQELYRFEVLALYKITLTVRDNDNNTAVNFTAVYSVTDSDSDGLPDWWEVEYFHGLLPSPTSDPDDDGYSNLEEFVHGTDPLAADPRQGFIESNWKLLSVAAVLAVGLSLAYLPWYKLKRKEREQRKIEYAVEIEKALDEEDE